MRLDSLALSLVTAAVFALAGCAAEPSDSSSENTDSTQAAANFDDRAHLVFSGQYDPQEIGGRSGVTFAGDYEKRMYDFNATPRIGQRGLYDVNLTVLDNASVVPHGGLLEGNEIRRGQDSNLGVTGPE